MGRFVCSGNSTLLARARCSVDVECTDTPICDSAGCGQYGVCVSRNKCVSIKCQGLLNLDEMFEDARDIDDSQEGNQEFPGGTAYRIVSKMRLRMSDSKCERTQLLIGQ